MTGISVFVRELSYVNIIHIKNRFICTAIYYWLVCVLGLQPIALCVHADSVSMRLESVED